MRITITEEADLNKWDKDLKQFPASVFIASAWLESLKNSNRIPLYLRFISAGETLGLIAGLALTPPNPLMRKFYKTLFFFSGPATIGSDKDLAASCINRLINFASCHGYYRLFLRSWDYPHPFEFETPRFNIKIRKEYIIDLRRDISDIRKKIRPSLKRQARKANKIGVTFHESCSSGSANDLISLLEHTKKTRLAKGYPDYSYFYMPFLNESILHKLLQNKIAKIFYAQTNNRILCAQLVLTHGKRSYGLLIGTNPEGYKAGANPFLLINVIERLKEGGINYLNLGGMPEDSSASALRFYKLSLGAEEHICMGGITPFLSGPLFHLNPLINIFDNGIKEMFKKILGKKIIEKLNSILINIYR